VDFTGGTVDAMVDSMTLGNGQPITGTGAGTATGTLTMSAGNLNVNTLEVAHQNNTGVTAANTGTLNINGGTLTVNTSLRLAFWGGSGGQSSGSIFLQDTGTVQANNIVAGGGNTSAVNLYGGTLIVSNTMGSAGSPLSALTVYTGTTVPTLQFSASSVAACQVKSLSGDGTGVIKISSLPPIPIYPSQFPLITYQSGSGSGLAFTMGALPGGFQGSISNDNSAIIYLVITNGPSLASVTWGGGVNNLWDTSTLNWTNASAATVAYANADSVIFTDKAKTNKVNVTATFTPGGWIMNNDNTNFTFSGTGSVTGSGGLAINGTNSVTTLSESGGDNFSGGIQVKAGTLVVDNANSAISGGLTISSGATAQIGNNDANGTLPSGFLDDEGTLVFKRTDNVLVSTIITGGGALTMNNGSGTLTLAGGNTYSGNTTVTAGTLALTNSGSIAGSAQVNVTGATLDVTGAANATTLTSLNLTNASLTVPVGYPQTDLNVTSLSMGGAVNTLNVSSLPVIAVYPTTVTVLKSASAITGFNMSVGSLPPGYAGTVVALSGDQTAILLTLTSGPIGVRPNVSWSGVDALANVNTNWSDNQNWQLPGAPISVDNVLFNNTAVTTNSALSIPGGGASALIPANINNKVDTDFAIASLTYTNGGTNNYHNTYITNGATLTITNFLTVGGVNANSTLVQQFVNIAGGQGATLIVTNSSTSSTNNAIEIWVGNSGTQASYAMLDMSGLDNFRAFVRKFTVGACAVDNAVNRPSGILYLAKTNIITATYQTTNDVEAASTTGVAGIDVGDCNQNQGPTNYVYLGLYNNFRANYIVIARQKDSSTMMFNTNYANHAPYPTVIFQGRGTSLVSNFDVGDGAGNTGTTAGTGDLNLLGGFVTATVDVMNIGRASGGASGAGTTTGTLEFEAGSITANTANVGLQPASGSKVGVGTVTVSTNTAFGTGALLVVNGDLSLGVNVDNSVAGTSGTLNINGGTVQANNIVAGINGAPSTINLNAGNLIVTGTAGTTAAPLTTLVLGNATTLQLNVNGSANVTNIVATTITPSGTITLTIGSLSGGAVTNVNYPLIKYTTGNPYSSLSLAALPAGYTGTLTNMTTRNIVGLHLTAVPAVALPVHFTSISVSGTTLHITGTNGVSLGQYVLIGTTNLTTPLSLWTRILTNNFDISGHVDLSTNIINSAVPQEFYIIVQ
jgi:autotransporter-associated beta strand protein